MLNKSIIILIFFFLYLFFGQLIAAWPFTMDDTFISLSYAKNLVEYGSLGWNKGNVIVEGYSNFSYVILAALAMKMGLNAVFVLKIFSIFMFSLTLCYLYHLCRLWVTPQFAFIPSLWLLSYKGQILWTVSGLETSTFQCLLLLSTYYLLRGFGYQVVTKNFQNETSFTLDTRAFLLCGLFLSLASLTRPETPLLMIIFLLMMFLFFSEFKTEKKHFFQAVGIVTIVYSIIYVPYFLWRWNYFGRFFPNSIYCKWLIHISQGILDWHYLLLIWPLLILSLPYFLWGKDKRAVLLICPSIIYLILLFDSDIISGFYNRLFLPAFCLLLPLPLFGLIQINQKYMHNQRYRHTSVYIGSIIVGIFLIPKFSLNDYYAYAMSSRKSIEYRFELVGWLKSHLKPDDSIVLADCGLVPYVLNVNVIDSYCLNNPLMTKPPINYSYPKFVNWVLTRKHPEIIILSAWYNNTKGYIEPAASYFLSNRLFHNQYCLKHTIKTTLDNQPYSYQIYQLRKS